MHNKIASSPACSAPPGPQTPKRAEDLRVAVVCNWGDDCGIATYSRYLVEAIRPLVGEIRLFTELPGDDSVVPCWNRGKSLLGLSKALRDWNPDAILIQHEFGIFPRATYWLQFLQQIADFPYLVTLHSVYKHLDKVVCTAPIKHAIVHSEEAKACLKGLGNGGEVAVIPHGCVEYEDVHENFNLFGTPYAITQFGFGFRYKGVEVALDAIAHLKRTQPDKYEEIFYCYLASENAATQRITQAYRASLEQRIAELGLEDNVAIVAGFQPDAVIQQYLRTARMAIFPYLTDPNNLVYGASGAARIAMANGVPTIASDSPMFSDLEGVIPRPDSPETLAATIDHIFSNGAARQNLLSRQSDFIRLHGWRNTAKRYVEAIARIVENSFVYSTKSA